MPLKSKTVRINKKEQPLPGCSLRGSAQAEHDQRVHKQVAQGPPVKTTHPDAERKAQYISFSYHGGVIVSAHLTVSAIWPATVEMQSEAAAETQTGICCWQVNSNMIHIEARVFSCPLNQSSCSIDGHVKSRARFWCGCWQKKAKPAEDNYTSRASPTLNQGNVNICARTIKFPSSSRTSESSHVNTGNQSIWNHLLIHISIWVFVIMAVPPILRNYRTARLSSEVHVTSAVISMCVRASENVWEWVYVYVTASGGLSRSVSVPVVDLWAFPSNAEA